MIPFTDKYKRPFFLLSLLLLILATVAKGQQFDEYELKSGYLFNFYHFVTWAKTDEVIYLAVYGESEMYDKILVEMAAIKNKPHKRWIITHYNKPEQIVNCSILFFTQAKTSEVIKVLANLRNQQVITVGDNIPNFCSMGGCVNFLSKESKKPFEINQSEAARLKISSKLLSISKIVQ